MPPAPGGSRILLVPTVFPRSGNARRAASGVLTYVPPTRQGLGGWAGEHVVVVGSGHSAMTAVIELAEVVRKHPSTR